MSAAQEHRAAQYSLLFRGFSASKRVLIWGFASVMTLALRRALVNRSPRVGQFVGRELDLPVSLA